MAQVPNGVYWIGTNGQVYVKGKNGVNAAGAYDSNSDRYWSDRGFGRIDDPNPQNPVSTALSGGYSSGGGYGSGGGTSVAAAPAADPSVLSYYDTLIGQANGSLGRLNTQRDVGVRNIDNSYNSSLNDLTESKALADRDLGIARESDIQGNIKARGKINTNVGNAITSGQRTLGANGAGRSSATRELLPFAVAKQGTDQQRDVADNFATNQRAFDLKAGDQQREFDKNKTALGSDRQNKINALDAGIAQSQASINQQIAGYQANKAQAQGKTYAQTQAITTPYTNAINNALDAATRLGATTTVAPVGPIKYTAPDLKAYDPTQITVGTQGETGVQQQTLPYYSLLTSAKDKEKRLVAA